MPVSDQALLHRVRHGDAHALSALYDRYGPWVFGLALRMVQQVSVAEDITQEVFLRVWQKAAQYHPQRGSVRTWLLTITRNLALDWLRKQKRRPPTRSLEGPEPLLPLPETTPSPEEQAILRWERDRLRQALQQLPAEQRTVLLLAYFEGLSHQQIARRLHCPLGTVKSRLRAAVKNLRRNLEELAPHPNE